MNSFWWFEENIIAGMARPGFNCTRWFDYSYEEAVLMGWLGLFSSGSASRENFHKHIEHYSPKIAQFYKLPEETRDQLNKVLYTTDGLENTLYGLTRKTRLLKDFSITTDTVSFDFCKERLLHEIAHLKDKGIVHIITLTEDHLNRDILKNDFQLHHFSIKDLHAPSFEQVQEMAEIIRKAKAHQQPLGVHCLAGIGRTSTMIIAAHMVLGETLATLLAQIKIKNPYFSLTGKQAEFITEVSRKLGI
ncbi:MAG: dual specificity protein phosphatase family protein [Bdellovibrionaceae bacterium]|nr:dual specificity protein phosphatase family protein [Pseudobdellovibrionaceae bacterium]